MSKIVEAILHANGDGHWVGDGFPVRTLFGYQGDARLLSPFLLFDYAGPHTFAPNSGAPRGVGQHPHRGFETVTIVYDGEVSHEDSSGGGGTIGAGDVQWMTAAGGILHEEFHSPGFSKTGGPFRMVQLWVNLPAKDKMTLAKYQAITNDDIPFVPFNGGRARVIAGKFQGVEGPATTFTPINMWDVRLDADTTVTFSLPEGHTSLIAVLSGRVTIAGQDACEAEIVRFSREGTSATIHADGDAVVLVLTGKPIDEPVVGYGPFVMNSETEIRQAIEDFNSGRFNQAAKQ
ncbi:MAG: pirin family protein [Gammaproteobacteria bacterium]|jgi:redox-sensitive bicupin YhaK (pirin superfamily)|nr:pirin family protein [Gammaproteobacteria bacterium]